MRKSPHRLPPLCAGFGRLWRELEIEEGRKITAADFAREASKPGEPVVATTPTRMMLGQGVPDEQRRRVYAYLGVDNSTVKDIGSGAGYLPGATTWAQAQGQREAGQ